MTTLEAYVVYLVFKAAFVCNRDWNKPERIKLQESLRGDYNRAWCRLLYEVEER